MLFISLLKLLQLCPLGALSGSFLSPFDMPCLKFLFIYFVSTSFLALKDASCLSGILPALHPVICPRSPGSFHWRILSYIEYYSESFSSILCRENCGIKWIDHLKGYFKYNHKLFNQTKMKVGHLEVFV